MSVGRHASGHSTFHCTSRYLRLFGVCAVQTPVCGIPGEVYGFVGDEFGRPVVLDRCGARWRHGRALA